MHHLSIDEIEKITDTSDLSTEYLTWYESVEEHIAECPLCREQIRRKILCDDLTNGSIKPKYLGRKWLGTLEEPHERTNPLRIAAESCFCEAEHVRRILDGVPLSVQIAQNSGKCKG